MVGGGGVRAEGRGHTTQTTEKSYGINKHIKEMWVWGGKGFEEKMKRT